MILRRLFSFLHLQLLNNYTMLLSRTTRQDPQEQRNADS